MSLTKHEISTSSRTYNSIFVVQVQFSICWCCLSKFLAFRKELQIRTFMYSFYNSFFCNFLKNHLVTYYLFAKFCFIWLTSPIVLGQIYFKFESRHRIAVFYKSRVINLSILLQKWSKIILCHFWYDHWSRTRFRWNPERNFLYLNVRKVTTWSVLLWIN